MAWTFLDSSKLSVGDQYDPESRRRARATREASQKRDVRPGDTREASEEQTARPGATLEASQEQAGRQGAAREREK